MIAPTATEIHEWSQVDFDRLGFAGERLERLIASVWAWLGSATGQNLAVMADDWALVPSGASARPLIEMVVQRKVEVMANQLTPDQAETLADFKLISTFSAGGYSETRRNLDELRKNVLIDADPLVNEALWPLMTPDQQDIWLGWLNGVNAPAFEITHVDWSGTWWDDRFGDYVGVTDPWEIEP